MDAVMLLMLGMIVLTIFFVVGVAIVLIVTVRRARARGGSRFIKADPAP